MARQNIDEEWKTDPRRDALIDRLKDSRLADGARVQLNWLILDHKGRPVPLKKFKFVKDHEIYIECGLAEIKGSEVHISGADRYAEFFDKQRANAAKPRRAKPNQKKPKLAKLSLTEPIEPSSSFSSSSSLSSSGSDSTSQGLPAEPVPEIKTLGSRIWDAYSLAYFDRYGTEPVRNKDTNSIAKRIGERLGEEGPEVARFFVSHAKAYYVSRLHDIGLLYADASPLRTQWATGRKITQRDAQQADNAETLAAQIKRLGEP